MNPIKVEKLFSLMKQYGIEHFKHEDLEISMRKDNALTGAGLEAGGSTTVSCPIVNPVSSPAPQAIPPVEVKIPHHVNEVANLLKLDDYALVDKLFPDYSQQPPKVEVG